MTPHDLDQTIRLGMQHHQAGRLIEAETAYRRVLAMSGEHPQVLHLLGMLAAQARQPAVALGLFRRAVAAGPSVAMYHDSLGKALAGSGDFDQASQCFSRAIELSPNEAEFHNNLGIARREQRRYRESLAAFNQALALRPEYVEAHYNMGNALRDDRQLEKAVAAYQRAIQLRPGLIEAHNNLAIVLADLHRLDQAIGIYRHIIELQPASGRARNNLGGALFKDGRIDEAMTMLNEAIRLEPSYAPAHVNRGVVLHRVNRFDESVASFQTAMCLSPRSADAHYHLADVLKDQGRLQDAIAAYRRAIELRPDYAEAYSALANLHREMEQLEQATVCCQRALALDAQLAEAHNVMGNLLRDQGQLDHAIACFRRAVELKNDAPTIHSNLVYSTYFHGDYDAARILAENRAWALRHEEPILAQGHPPHQNDRSPDRRLKIGYVSPDFRQHPAASFMLPLLANHDPAQVEVFCYSGVKQPDKVTAQCRKLAHVWRDMAGTSDESFAQRVRDDRIDILIDLTLHMAFNRLLAFARKPAPVQVTWLGYPGTTGMRSIDYRLSDPQLDPPGQGDEFYSERTFRLPHTFWCYEPPVKTLAVNTLPAVEKGFVTFACFNHFAKVTPPTLDLWGQTLASIPHSQMLILCSPGPHRQRVVEAFERFGVAGDRIEFVGRLPPEDYFRLFHRVDLCLDPIPYPGHTSALDGLWMGVPAVTLTGQTAASRGGASLLTNLNLPQFIAHTPAEYLQIAQRFAGDLPALAQVRANLRQQMSASPLMDAKAFAKAMEDAFRQMWRAYCGEGCATQ